MGKHELDETETKDRITLNNNVYDALKRIVQVVLPALGTLYFSLAAIWGFPYAEQVVGTITALALCLGIILGISNSNYKKNETFDGSFVVDTIDPMKDTYTLEIDTPLDTIDKRDTITLKVKANT